MPKPIAIIQNTETETAGTILEWLTEQQLPFTVTKMYSGQEPPAVEDIKAAIVLGCPYSVRDYLRYGFLRKLYDFVVQAVSFDLPYLGICFGAQILAAVLDAEVKPNPVKEIGSYRLWLTDEGCGDPLLKGFKTSFMAFQWHGDTFDIPYGAQLLVEGDDCKNQAFRKGNAIGLQFHLEAHPDDVPLWCEVNRVELREFGRTKKEITDEYRDIADEARSYNFRLLENFLG